ncbi:hypothetical protein ACLB2K_069800 [Fragaria x ananassa]
MGTGDLALVHGEPLLGVIRVCYNIALHSKSPVNQATSKAMLTQMISIIFRRMETDPDLQVSSSASVGNLEAITTQNSNTEAAETSAADQNEKEMTLGDQLNQAKETSIASVEELHNLAGGLTSRYILFFSNRCAWYLMHSQGLEAVLDKAGHHEDGKKITRGIDLESMSIVQRDALLVFRNLCKMGMKEITMKLR